MRQNECLKICRAEKGLHRHPLDSHHSEVGLVCWHHNNIEVMLRISHARVLRIFSHDSISKRINYPAQYSSERGCLDTEVSSGIQNIVAIQLYLSHLSFRVDPWLSVEPASFHSRCTSFQRKKHRIFYYNSELEINVKPFLLVTFMTFLNLSCSSSVALNITTASAIPQDPGHFSSNLSISI